MDSKHIFITDIGSTTTKGLLIERDKNDIRFLGSIELPTTVEKPSEDVKIGVLAVCEELEKETGVKLLGNDGNIAVPYYSTSSAGGGLQMLVFGLSSTDTGRVAQTAAFGAGGVILRTFTIDDDISTVEKIRTIRELHPDIILMAGGIDGGAVAGVVRQAEMLAMSNPEPKFRTSSKIPLVFCGNVEARPFVSKILSETFDMHMVGNLRPDLEKINIEPTREKIHELFMDNVMERAPGYDGLKNWVSGDIIPTPEGVENILRLYCESENNNALLVDIGGATTDIFTNIAGQYRRTVAANIGMSYSLSNILGQAGISKISRHLPDNFAENDIRNYMVNKTLKPTYKPTNDSEIRIEQTAAIEGIAIAWKQHKRLNFKMAKVGFLDKRRKKEDYDPFSEVFKYDANEDLRFQISDIDVIIGAGGVISHTRNNRDVLWMLLEGLRPSGVTKLAVDKGFKTPHLGVLATEEPKAALKLLKQECIEDIGYVVAPTGKIKPDRDVLKIEDKRNLKSYTVKGGEILFLENGGEIEIETAGKISLANAGENTKLTTKLPIIIDCRGRGESALANVAAKSGVKQFKYNGEPFKTALEFRSSKIAKREYRIKRDLPYEGTLFVSNGDTVSPKDEIGENCFAPPRIYIIDLNKRVGYSKPLEQEEFDTGILVKIGDKVSNGDNLLKAKIGILDTDAYISSPVRGIVTDIEPNGLIIMREIQDYSRKPVVVDVAKRLGIKPQHIRSRLKVKVGQFVEKGQTIANYEKAFLTLHSPTTGTVENIDTENGTITIHYNTTATPLSAFVPGEIVDVKDNIGATIIGTGEILYGTVGFGNENFGALTLYDKSASDSDLEGKIIVSFKPINADFLRNAVHNEVTGVIAPSINNSDWVDFYGGELGVMLTGDEDIPFTLILTEGFGEIEMNQPYQDFLTTNFGNNASLSGRTQIRAGVTRPMVIVSG